jgi:hypothetical protein
MALLCITPLEAQLKRAIYFYHIGSQDRSFKVVIINTERDDSDASLEDGIIFYEYCKVSDQVFKEIKTLIQESRHVVRVRDRRARAYGSFEIVIEEAGEKNSYYVQGREVSLKFFYELIKRSLEREGLDRLVKELDRVYFNEMIY